MAENHKEILLTVKQELELLNKCENIASVAELTRDRD
jgi:hypothetical protein